jgi:hypothetical protein
MIDKLTPEQEAKIPAYLDEYMRIGLSTEPCDKIKAEEAIARSYAYLKLPAPKFHWTSSPFAGAKLAAQINKGSEDVTKEEISEMASKASYGSFEAYWVAFYAFIAEQLPVQKDELIDIVKDIIKNSGVYWTFKNNVVISEKPVAIHMKDKKLHNPDGLALEYPDGTGIFAIEGKSYPSLLDMTIAEHSKEK